MSITSMTNRARMAENLTIDQLKQSIQDGVVPSYIGVPLLKSKVEDAKLLQAAKAAQNMGQQPSVAQQIMSQAQQVSQPAPQMAPQAGVEGLSTNLPPSMAGGGIVAFAEGGMYDDEDSDEDRQDAARQAEMDEMMDEYAQSFQAGIGQLPAAQEYAPATESKEDNADFIARIMHKESRGRRYGKDGQLLTSEKGAQGEMQVMPGTSRDPGFGVKAARDNSPDELARVGRDYANTLLQRYGDPKLAAIAYNMGPGATDKWLASGADISKLPKETQGYVKGFAGGGDVKHFATGNFVTDAMGNVTSDDSYPVDDDRTIMEKLGIFNPENRRALEAAKKTAVKANVKPEYNEDFMRRFDQAGERYMNERAAAKAAPEAAATTPAAVVNPVANASQMPEPSRMSAYEQAITDALGKREENLVKQREQDKYMAMLQAGLGMMGGTSQHALANIGAGATQGIQSLAQANAARTAEENALLSGRLGLAKIGANKEYQDAMMKYRQDLAGSNDARARELAGAKLTESKALHASNADQKTGKYLSDIEDRIRTQVSKDVAANALLSMKPDVEAIKEQMVQDRLRAHGTYGRKYKEYHGEDAFASIGGGKGDNAGWSIKPK